MSVHAIPGRGIRRAGPAGPAGSPRRRRRGTLAALGLLAAAGPPLGCASTDLVAPDVELARREAVAAAVVDLAPDGPSPGAAGPKRWFLQIDFDPNDFGIFYSRRGMQPIPPGSERARVLHASDAPFRGLAEGEPITLPDHLQPLSVSWPDVPGSLGLFEYRYKESRRAIDGLAHLLVDPRTTLRETLVVVTGGSHGASEANAFARLLRERFGKEPDVVVLGDAIARPGPFPPTTMGNVSGTRSTVINLYQRDSFLAGLPLHGTDANIRVEGSGHAEVAELAEPVGRAIIREVARGRVAGADGTARADAEAEAGLGAAGGGPGTRKRDAAGSPVLAEARGARTSPATTPGSIDAAEARAVPPAGRSRPERGSGPRSSERTGAEPASRLARGLEGLFAILMAILLVGAVLVGVVLLAGVAGVTAVISAVIRRAHAVDVAAAARRARAARRTRSPGRVGGAR